MYISIKSWILCSEEIGMSQSREARPHRTFNIGVLRIQETLFDGPSLSSLETCEEIVLGSYLSKVGSILQVKIKNCRMLSLYDSPL